MSLIDDLTKQSEKYQKQLQGLNIATLSFIVSDRTRALEYAKKGIQEVEPENLTDEYVETVADEMQRVAKMFLEEKIK